MICIGKNMNSNSAIIVKLGSFIVMHVSHTQEPDKSKNTLTIIIEQLK